ncbi:hypothetical protein ABID65_007546 [Bradyrhizobium sp. S3.9.2]|uniref:hypothetical protein n=1 Tax=Bradyrhizobium sp. S3.9.2 TaxID=3156432 RepID=UPI0033955319
MKTAADIIVSALKRGKTNAEALAAAKHAHPRTTLSLPSVNWYRNRLQAEGAKVPTEREARRRRTTQKPF